MIAMFIDRAHHFLDAFARIIVLPVPQMHVHQFVLGVTQHVGEGAIHFIDLAAFLHDDDAVARLVDEDLAPMRFFTQ
jgi:hypothetical protein